MKRVSITILFSFLVFFLSAQQICSSIVMPQLSEATRKDFENKLAISKADHEKDNANADAIIWYGRRTASMGKYEEAIEIFTKGIALHPDNARMYRHRGHRYITVRCFDKAIQDFKKAAQLIKGKPDEIEPDGLPNAKNIPTSTLQSNIWYHLGLAYFLKGEYKKARKAYAECLKVSKNPDMYVATANWMYITLRKLNRNKEAEDLLKTINANTELLESGDYLRILLLYKQPKDLKDPEKEIENSTTLSSATYGFGLGYHLLLKGKKEEAKKIFQKVLNGNQWSSFGFIAAEAELSRLN